MASEHKYDLISLPFAFFWQVTVLMLPMLLIVRQYDVVGLYLFWYRKLPPWEGGAVESGEVIKAQAVT